MRNAILLFVLVIIGLNGKSQTEMKQKSNLDSTELEKFLTVNHNYIKIPILKITSGHLLIKAKLNGVEGDFILDTGSGGTVIDISKEDKFKIKIDTLNDEAVGAGGSLSLQHSVNNTFKLGKLLKKDFEIYVMNLDNVNNALTLMGMNVVDGVIGADILVGNKAIIDYSNLILYLQL